MQTSAHFGREISPRCFTPTTDVKNARLAPQGKRQDHLGGGNHPCWLNTSLTVDSKLRMRFRIQHVGHARKEVVAADAVKTLKTNDQITSGRSKAVLTMKLGSPIRRERARLVEFVIGTLLSAIKNEVRRDMNRICAMLLRSLGNVQRPYAIGANVLILRNEAGALWHFDPVDITIRRTVDDHGCVDRDFPHALCVADIGLKEAVLSGPRVAAENWASVVTEIAVFNDPHDGRSKQPASAKDGDNRARHELVLRATSKRRAQLRRCLVHGPADGQTPSSTPSRAFILARRDLDFAQRGECFFIRAKRDHRQLGMERFRLFTHDRLACCAHVPGLEQSATCAS